MPARQDIWLQPGYVLNVQPPVPDYAPILDNFNTIANQDLNQRIGWGPDIIFTGDGTLRTNSVPNKAATTSTPNSNYWYTNKKDVEVGVVMSISKGATNQIALYGRITSINSVTAYCVNIDASDVWSFSRYLASTPTSFGPTAVQSLSIQDLFRLVIVGNKLTAQYKPYSLSGSSWTTIITATDNVISDSGFFGVRTSGAGTINIDAFFGGDPV